MPDENSEVQLVGFQCTAKDFRQITEAAENDQCATSEWIRRTLMEAVRRASHDERFPRSD